MSNKICHFYIVTPCFNAAAYLDETISSVVTQAGNFYITYHIQDGGSTDGTVSKLKSWSKSLCAPGPWLQCKGVRFSWSSESDCGMYDAINKGFLVLNVSADGIMAWINADDTYFPHAFSTVAKAFFDLPLMQWFGGMIAIIDENGGFAPAPALDYYPNGLVRGNCCDGVHWWHLQQNGIFWRRSLWDHAGPLNVELRFAGDCALWPQFAQRADFFHLPVYIGAFRKREGQLSSFLQYAEDVDQVVSREIRRKIARNFFLRYPCLAKVPRLALDASGFYVVVRKRSLSALYSYYSCLRLIRIFLPVKIFNSFKKITKNLVCFCKKLK